MSIRGKAFVFIAPSGGGKSTLLNMLQKDFPDFKFSISCTTRAPRGQERHGVEYFFLTKEEFEQGIQDNLFVEYANVFGNYYGTKKSFIEDKLSNGEMILMDIDVQGADIFKKTFGRDAVCIFIAPPSREVLEKRLRGRGTDSEEAIVKRLNTALKEMERQNDFDYLIINDKLDEAYNNLKAIVEKEIGE